MRWDDLNSIIIEYKPSKIFEGSIIWTIPSSAREKGTAGQLKLPALAVDIINSLPRILGNPYVFAGRGGFFWGFSKSKRRLDELSGVSDWVLHDCRRTARSLMARAGVMPHVAERVLGHAIPGVEGVYDRHSYDVEKADALNRLAALITRALHPVEAERRGHHRRSRLDL